MKIGTNNLATRDAWLSKTLRRIPAGFKILDAGAGNLRLKKYCGHLRYTSQDFGKKIVEKGLAWENTQVDIVSDIAKIPVGDGSFDAVLCVEVLEHVLFPHLAIAEFSRILKPGGKLILTAPFCSLTHMAPYYYANGFSRYWYLEILKIYGFEEIKSEANGNFFDYLAQEWRRLFSVKGKYTRLTVKYRLVVTAILRLMTPFVLFVLEILSGNDHGSSEMLCFGYQVTAVKTKRRILK